MTINNPARKVTRGKMSLIPYRIFYNWSNGDRQDFLDDLIETGHFGEKDVNDFVESTEAIIVYWVQNWPFMITYSNNLCHLEIQNQSWKEPLASLDKLEDRLSDWLKNENYTF